MTESKIYHMDVDQVLQSELHPPIEMKNIDALAIVEYDQTDLNKDIRFII